MMDPEPGRCRRTDGKRWRCSRSVVADQKYCERHMHRGRQRSRKIVEGSEYILKTDLPIDKTSSSLPSENSTNNTNSNNKMDISTLTDSQLASPASSNTRNGVAIAVNIISPSSTSAKKASNNNNVNLSATPEIIMSHNSNNVGNRIDMYNTNSSCIASTSFEAAVVNNRTRKRSNYIDGKHVGFNHNKVGVISSSNRGKECCFGGFNRLVYDSSPKSVLQGGRDASCRSLGFDYKSVTEAEPQRCRRTDGKKWRCSWDVVHGQKYCEKHMHRGAKRVATISNLATIVPASAPSTSSNSPFLVAKRVDNCINLNINPSPQIAANPLRTNGDDRTSSSSSDATTITD